MGTTIFEFTVVSRDPRTGAVVIKIKIVYEDVTDWGVTDLGFCFQLMCEFLWQRCSMGGWVPWGGTDNKERPIAPKPDEPEYPSLAFEIGADGNVRDEFVYKNVRSFIKETSYDSETKQLTIVPTHPSWTDMFDTEVNNFKDSGAYVMQDPDQQDKYDRSAPVLFPIDRSSPVEPEEDLEKGFERRVAKAALERAKRARKEEGNQGSAFGTDVPEVTSEPILFPIHPDGRYCVAKMPDGAEPPSVQQLAAESAPVIFQGFFGGGANRVGNLVEVQENGQCRVYYESDGVRGFMGVAPGGIKGRAALAKPRRRLER